MPIILIYITLLLLVIMSLVKLRHSDSCSSVKPFDVNATLPIRGILAMLIVAYHLGQKYGASPMYLFTACSGPVVSTFFFISGYGLIKSYQKKGKRYLDHFLSNRLNKILPLFLLLTGIFIIFPLNPEVTTKEALLAFLYGETALPNSWFIIAIVYFYIAFYWSCKFSRSALGLIRNIAIATIFYFALTIALNFGGWWYSACPSFLFGILIATYEYKYLRLLTKYSVATIGLYIALVVASIVFQSHYFSYIPQNALIGRIAFFTLVPISVMISVNAMGMVSNRFLRYLGNLSLDIYLIHGIFITLLVQRGYSWLPSTVATFTFTIAVASVWRSVLRATQKLQNTPPPINKL